MKIRQKLTLQFFLMASVIMLLFSLAVYIASADYRRDDFYQRLESRAISTARLLIEVDEVDADLLTKIEEDNPVSLPDEKIIIFNYKNEIVYSTDTRNVILYDDDLLTRIRTSGEVRTKSGRYELMGILFPEEYNRFVVLSAARDIYGFDKMKNLRTILLLLTGIFLVLFYPAGWLFAARSLSPISKVVDRVDKISISSLDLRVDEGNGKDELAHLAHTFNRMLERLETAFEVQKDFISNASHELRTPISVIQASLDVVEKEDGERLSPLSRQIFDDLKDEVRRMSRLTSSLLTLARADTGTMELNREQFGVEAVAQHVFRAMLPLAQGRGLKLELSLCREVELYADKDRITQLLMILMDNGIKFTPTGGQVTLLIDREKNGAALLEVSDTGIGVSPEDRQHIFERFYRADKARSREEGGAGLGLSIAAWIVNAHGGSIEARSGAGGGTVFRVLLPTVSK